MNAKEAPSIGAFFISFFHEAASAWFEFFRANIRPAAAARTEDFSAARAVIKTARFLWIFSGKSAIISLLAYSKLNFSERE
jgi:hypothetical protein